ncbi:MAG: endonuclease/exonuclease/phosphatase family protein [Acidobacteria bacterium]|nr:endonuclease/exonuclease/phosphatase family protein [Acidobacteriota bacterium]
MSRRPRLRQLLLFATTILVIRAAIMAVEAKQQSLPNETTGLMQGSFSAGRTPNRSLKILNWNIRYGTEFSGIAETIKRENPDISLLQEVDFHAQRSKQRNVAEELARQLSVNYVFGIEFEELSQKSGKTPAYTGQAVLTGFPIRSSRVLRFTRQTDWWAPRWYIPNWNMFQRRMGGRMAIVTTIDVDGMPLVVYNTHLEGQGSPQLRLEQVNEILKDMQQYSSDACIILAGDFNTKKLPSPAINRLIGADFRVAAGEGVTRRGGSTLDWILVRGPIVSDGPKVLRDVFASDHFPLTVSLTPSRTAHRAEDLNR